MKRLIYDSLLKWKESPLRKPLILLGARQVGKTYILKKFGADEYSGVVYVNCHNNPVAENLFKEDFDMPRIFLQLEALTGVKPLAGETLIIFDEIQEIRNGIASLKYFCENAPEFHIAVAGSLLGISLRGEESYPVGKVDTLHMYPMGFEEFLMAKGENILIDAIKEGQWDVVLPFHDKLTQILREYYYVGGMPEVVKAYMDGIQLQEIRGLQLQILDAYYRDMAKHTVSQVEKIRLVWRSVPSQLARENKKFIFGAVRKGGRGRDFEESLQWLVDCGLIIKIDRVKEGRPPLKFYSDISEFKVYLLDVGLLGAAFDTEAIDVLTGDNAFKEFKGAFTENYVAQQLQLKLDSSFYYYSQDIPNMEIDFLYSLGKRVIAIESKAEQNVRSKSLYKFTEIEKNIGVDIKSLRFSMLPYIKQDWMTNIPLYGIFNQY